MSEVKLANEAGAGLRRRGAALSFWVFLVIAAVAATGAGLVMKNQEQGFLSRMMAAESDQRIELLISASIEDIISEDVPRLETILEQVMANDPDVYSIRISDEDDKVLVSQKKAANARSGDVLPFMNSDFPLQRMLKTVRFEGDSYGKMAVEWDTSRTGLMIEKHAYRAASTVAIVCLLFGLLGYWFGRPRA
jgi:hypothetical protein